MASGVLLSGCTGGPAEGAPTPVRSQGIAPAAEAGGACLLLDFAELHRLLGMTFEVAGAAELDNTSTCVVRPAGAATPELSLSVTPTRADASVFKDKLVPSGAKAVTGLGRVAFQATPAVAKGRSPALEVGWLTGDSRLMSLKLVVPADDPSADVASLAPKLVEVARLLDRTSV